MIGIRNGGPSSEDQPLTCGGYANSRKLASELFKVRKKLHIWCEKHYEWRNTFSFIPPPTNQPFIHVSVHLSSHTSIHLPMYLWYLFIYHSPIESSRYLCIFHSLTYPLMYSSISIAAVANDKLSSRVQKSKIGVKN